MANLKRDENGTCIVVVVVVAAAVVVLERIIISDCLQDSILFIYKPWISEHGLAPPIWLLIC